MGLSCIGFTDYGPTGGAYTVACPGEQLSLFGNDGDYAHAAYEEPSKPTALEDQTIQANPSRMKGGLIGRTRVDYAISVSEEYDELLSMLGTLEGDEEKGKDDLVASEDASVPYTADILDDTDAAVYRWTAVRSLKLPARPDNALRQKGIATIGELVARLDEVAAIRGMGEKSLWLINDALEDRSRELSPSVSDAQILALRKVSGSETFVFDVFGRLCHARESGVPNGSLWGSASLATDAGVGQTPLDSVTLSAPLRYALKVLGCITVEQAMLVDEATLRSFRGVGTKAIHGLREAWEDVSTQPKQTDVVSIDQQAIEGVQMADALCRERGYPIFFSAFHATMPLFAIETLGPGQVAETYRDAVLESFELTPDLVEVCVDSLRHRVQELRSRGGLSATGSTISLSPAPVWEFAACIVADEDPWLVYEEDEYALRIEPPFARFGRYDLIEDE